MYWGIPRIVRRWRKIKTGILENEKWLPFWEQVLYFNHCDISVKSVKRNLWGNQNNIF